MDKVLLLCMFQYTAAKTRLILRNCQAESKQMTNLALA